MGLIALARHYNFWFNSNVSGVSTHICYVPLPFKQYLKNSDWIWRISFLQYRKGNVNTYNVVASHFLIYLPPFIPTYLPASLAILKIDHSVSVAKIRLLWQWENDFANKLVIFLRPYIYAREVAWGMNHIHIFWLSPRGGS